eukprot:jgi/Botrbrau1/4514/Bobra.60_2s0005.1
MVLRHHTQSPDKMAGRRGAQVQHGKLKVTFHTEYRTRWGENVVVYGDTTELGKWQVDKGKVMRCQEKKLENRLEWDQTIMLSPRSQYNYRYAVVDEARHVADEEREIRTLEIPDKIEDGLKVEVFDEWQGTDPAMLALSRSAFTDVIFRNRFARHESQPQREQPAPGHVLLRFILRDWNLQEGEDIVVTGGVTQLGLWQEHASLPMVEVFESCADSHGPSGEGASPASQPPRYETEVLLPLKAFPLTYKYAVRNKDDFIREAGDNRVVTVDNPDPQAVFEERDAPVLLVRDDGYFRHEDLWRGAGVVAPVFSLRTKNSVGAGDFCDLKILVDFCVATGLRLIQLLPVNDTSVHDTWWDSYPYSSVSVFALHPIYLSLKSTLRESAPEIEAAISAAQEKLEGLPHVDYVETKRCKLEIARRIFELQGEHDFQSPEFKAYKKENAWWLEPYAVFGVLRDLFRTSNHWEWGKFSKFSEQELQYLLSPTQDHYHKLQFTYWIQWHLHQQLLDASQYASQHSVILKGDLPIGVDRASVDTWMYPRLFRMEYSTGAPPDQFSSQGQNWGFPTYNWEEMAVDNYAWWRLRLSVMARYFHAYRIDHILGFFRIWEIPGDCTGGLLGHFRPSQPITRAELESRGIWDIDRLCDPYITPDLLYKHFGDLASTVLDDYLEPHYPGRLRFKPKYRSEKQIEMIRADKTAGSETQDTYDTIRTGLFALRQNVVLLHDAERPDNFFPRFELQKTSSFQGLPPEWQSSLLELHDSYMFHRHSGLWERHAMHTLPVLTRSSNMLVCGEDLGFVPDCVPPVMKRLGILGLNIQRFGEGEEKRFLDPALYPHLSVASPSCHDMAPIRAWWEDSSLEDRSYFMAEMLKEDRDPPDVCDSSIVKAVVQQHTDCPAMFAIFALQDLMGMCPEYCGRAASDEVINDPSNPRHYWRFRFHVKLEELIANKPFVANIHDMLLRSGRVSG